jgi:FkbM family methyltransferase
MSKLTDSIYRYEAKTGKSEAASQALGPLERLEWYFQEYFLEKRVRSVQTGCSASTIIFAQYSAHHTVYCHDDRRSCNSSVRHVQGFPGLAKDHLKWIYGSTVRTLLAVPPKQPIDIVLIDGPHGYPVPELQYFVFYKSLRPGGILVIDDIHIPTNYNLYEFLLQDDSFRAHGVAQATAYFQRTFTPPFDPENDEWWLQRYNVQRFPALHWSWPTEGVALPITLELGCDAGALPSVLERGFSLSGGSAVTEGPISTVVLRLAQPVPQSVTLELVIEPVTIDEREGSGVTILANAREIGRWNFESPGRRRIQLGCQTEGRETLSLEFWNHGLKYAKDLEHWPAQWFDARLPNFRLYSLSVKDALNDAKPTILKRTNGSLVTFDYEGRDFTFFVDQPDDSVQIFHTVGRFYELSELEVLRSRIPRGACILDVGAHVGNHTVYFERVMEAKLVVPIEPNPRARFLLQMNCLLNALHAVDLSHLGIALGATDGTGSLLTVDLFNSGGTRVELDDGPVVVYRGDDLLTGYNFDLIKIDVEGMELEVLAGLAHTIERCRPFIFIEVRDENREQFNLLVGQWAYTVEWEGQMYPGITNIFLRAFDRAICHRDRAD